ncbi:MAG: hypothetical protein R3B96_16655 [Pirellulaceae bacterium]
MKPSLLGPAPSISARHSKAPTREARNAAVNWKCCLASSLLVVLLLASLAPAARGQETDRTWYRGNLHTHSLWSDGNDFPEMIADWYKSNGYHFLGLSDHNILSRGERWIAADTPQKRGAIQGIERYQARFGADGVETREVDGVAQVRLKNLDEVRGLLEEPGQFILIESEEITDSFENLPIHINATNIGELVRPQGGSSKVRHDRRESSGRRGSSASNWVAPSCRISITQTLVGAFRRSIWPPWNGNVSLKSSMGTRRCGSWAMIRTRASNDSGISPTRCVCPITRPHR